MSWNSAPSTKRSGRSTRSDQTGGVHCGLPQVPIDGVRVVGVALRLEAHGLPLRQQPDPEPALVERLDHRQRRFAAQQQVDQQLARLVGPGIGQRGRRPSQAIERAPLDARVVAGGRGRDAQWRERDRSRRRPRRATRPRLRAARCPPPRSRSREIRRWNGPASEESIRNQTSSLVHAMRRAAAAETSRISSSASL